MNKVNRYECYINIGGHEIQSSGFRTKKDAIMWAERMPGIVYVKHIKTNKKVWKR